MSNLLAIQARITGERESASIYWNPGVLYDPGYRIDPLFGRLVVADISTRRREPLMLVPIPDGHNVEINLSSCRYAYYARVSQFFTEQETVVYNQDTDTKARYALHLYGRIRVFARMYSSSGMFFALDCLHLPDSGFLKREYPKHGGLKYYDTLEEDAR